MSNDSMPARRVPPRILKDASRPIPRSIRERLLDRLEAALIAGSLPVNQHLYIAVLRALLQEDFVDGPVPARPTETAPGSRARVHVYLARLRQGQSLYHPADATDDSRSRRNYSRGRWLKVDWCEEERAA